MSDEGTGANGSGDDAGGGPKSGKSRMKDGFRDGLGVLSAFKDALEETIHEARERGDLSADRAKDVLKDTLDKAQTAAEGARERLDFSTQGEMESMQAAVADIRERLAALEESVFGAAKDAGGAGNDPGARSEGNPPE